MHFDKGILYSFKQLFTRPGHSVREFIEGKRVKHFKPLSLAVVLATLYGFLYHFFNVDLFDKSSQIDLKDFNEWSITHYSWITVGTIPFYTIGTCISFRKQGYNFMEYFVLNTFKASQKLFLHLALFPLIYHFRETPNLKRITLLIYLIDLVLIFWTNIQFFNKISRIKAIMLSILSHIIFLICFTTIIIFALAVLGKLPL